MKRSQINYAIDKAHAIAESFRICLPEFASFTADIWAKKRTEEWREVRDLQLGWDITDFGSGRFQETGLTLLTLRNGAPGDSRYPKPYAEKMLQIQQDQQTPWHFHYHKMEDILNRGGGLPPTLYHRFWAENALVMGWEISMVNDDKRDNRFLEESGRFPMIQEDEPKKWLLCSEYGR